MLELIMDSSAVYFTIVIIVLFWIYKKLFDKKDTLASLGIAHDKPLPFFGNTLSIVLKRENFIEFADRLYETYAEQK